MSHLPLDARAILDYLNELGYRNISAQQLKEFLKGMQPQSEVNKSKLKAKSSSNQQQQPHQLPSSTRTTSATAAGAIESQPQSAQRRTIVKVIKCKKPLCHFKFYLDICDHQLAKRIEEQIKALGGALEFFLTPSVTHFITDKAVLPPTVGNNNNSLSSRPGTPLTPGTPNTPQTPFSFESNEGKNNGNNTPIGTRKTRQTRADAILNRARRPSTTAATAAISNANVNASTSVEHPSFLKQNIATSQAYIVWQTEYAIHFFKKVQHELKDYLTRDRRITVKGCTVEPISLKGGFIKIEAIKRNYRPYYQLFRKSSGTEWPKIELTQDDGAFRLSPRKKSPIRNADQAIVIQEKKKMTRKSRSRSSQKQSAIPTAAHALKKAEVGMKTGGGTGHRNSNVGGAGCKQQAKESSDKQCGVCEICKIEYDTLTIHLKTKDHEYFAKNSQNFIALDTLIHTSADVNKFLNEDKKIELKSELEEMEVENDLIADVNEPDPLEGSEPLVLPQEEIRRSLGANKTPSPTIREKSKRSTKGKHSSEKFQHNAAHHSKPTKTPLKSSSSSLKKASSSTLELQRIENAAVSAKASSTRRKLSTTTAASPPIRAMLPPSSLYKVVETPEIYTPSRKLRESGEQAVASPSLIVKFKKVRTAELNRLHGEAESFMFPKRQTSSELPTDIDRHTTSDNVRVSVSSGSLDSTSELMDIDMENNGSSSKATIPIGKRAIAIAKRRKDPHLAPKQSFPNTPIQPKVQLKQRKSSTATATTTPTTAAAATISATASVTITAATSKITLPEATRKSSRTATAIVTAATTSSRLLRAAVEAAKSNKRRKAVKETVSLPTNCQNCLPATPEAKSQSKMSTNLVELRSRVPVVSMEDRMGEKQANPDEDDNSEKSDVANEDSYNEQDYEDEDDYENDKDYVHYKKVNSGIGCNFTFNGKYASTRKQRAIQRDLRKIELCAPVAAAVCKEKSLNGDLQNLSPPKTATNYNTQGSVSLKSKLASRFFDYSNSVLLNKIRYAFERLPAGDLWHRVFSRQDACEENYFEYYGSTNYRKLPYELGPIPFKRTLDGINCKLCSVSNSKTKSESEIRNYVIKQELDEDSGVKHKGPTIDTNMYNSIACTSGSSGSFFGTQPSSSLKYTHKHKKLHLLQRYRQEQQELIQNQQEQDEQRATTLNDSSIAGAVLKCDSKASTPDRENCRERERERERAGSIHSNTSSSASSTATINKLKYRNKHLSKAGFMNLELPPRKSPREHASTLALVSCIIKQRQDSQSKPNSETDEPPSTPTAIAESREECRELNATIKVETLTPTNADVLTVRSPRHTRSAVVTPVEELCFTTEISENVKRMRRGQNKYDHSPPIILPTSRAARGRQPKSPVGRRPYLQKYRSQTPNLIKRRKREKNAYSSAKHHSYSGLLAQGSAIPSIRKTGSKKGVLEFEVDSTALKALDAATKHTNVRQLEWEIDKYLQLAGREYDFDLGTITGSKDAITISAGTKIGVKPKNAASTSNSARKNSISTLKSAESTGTAFESNTPPPTDCFSSDFDLCDLFPNTLHGNCSDEEQVDGARKNFSLYNSMALNNYFRRRKNLKSNRTGWPKVQKKKSSARQQQILEQKIRFLQDIGQLDRNEVEKVAAKQVEGDLETDERSKRENGVITPPDSEVGGNRNDKVMANEDEDADDTELDAADSIPEEDDAETMADSVEEDEGEEGEEGEADVDADADVEADEEDDGDGDGECEGDDAEDTTFEATKKRTRRSTVVSPVEKLSNSLTTNRASGTTSTPSTQMLRGLRRTPQLNGSLGSCVSPSEKAGDNSDIFTVSSDGLDTDLDISNSHSQQKGDDEHHHHHNHHHQHQHQHQEQCPNHTPKRKFDLSKYAPNNATTNSCAAEAATAAVKSLAISQFLKKEVRVNCRRIRAPFRRFRYRR